MNYLRFITIVCLFSLVPKLSAASETTNDDYSIQIEPFSEGNHFTDPDWYNWGGSMVQGVDKKYYLFYSRWPRSRGFLAWLTHSEVAVAVSDKPSGPWVYKDTALKGRKGEHWDAVTAHNPKVKLFDGKYYLYYISTQGDYSEQQLREVAKGGYSGKHWKSLRNNQRTGVAVSDKITGPWKRMPSPLVEPAEPLHTITVNPAVTQMPDGRYLLMIKGDKFPKPGSQRIQAVGIAEKPWGPFTFEPKPAISDFDTEDASLWYDKARKRYYAIFHAHSHFGMITSTNGTDWQKAKHYKVSPKALKKEDGSTFTAQRIERPSVFIGEKGAPEVFISSYKKGNKTGIFTIPLK